MRKERVARGWSLREFAARSGIDIGHASRVENGKQPPTENLAARCDAAFPSGRLVRGILRRAANLVRGPGRVQGLGRAARRRPPRSATGGRPSSPGCCRPRTTPGRCCGPTQESAPTPSPRGWPPGWSASAGLFARDPWAWFIIDELALYRLRRLAAGHGRPAPAPGFGRRDAERDRCRSCRPSPTPVPSSGFILADESAYAEHAAGGFAYPAGEIASALARDLDTLRGECYRVSESAALLERTGERMDWRKSSYSGAERRSLPRDSHRQRHGPGARHHRPRPSDA